MADLAVLSVMSNNSNKILAVESDFSRNSRDNKFKFKEMLEKAGNKSEIAESRKERNPEAQESKETEKTQDINAELEPEFVASNSKADSVEDSIQGFMLSNLNTESEQLVVKEATDVDLQQEMFVVNPTEIDIDLQQQILPQKIKVDEESIVEVDIMQELVVADADVDGYIPIKLPIKPEEKEKQAKEIDVILPQEGMKTDDLIQELVLGSQFLPLPSVQKLNLDSELLDLSDNLIKNPLSVEVMQLSGIRKEKQEKVDVEIDIITKSDGGDVKNFGQNDAKPEFLVHAKIVVPAVEMLRQEIEATGDVNDQLSGDRELIDSNSRGFVIQLDSDKKPVISFKEIASQQLENIPHRNDQVRMAVETAVKNGYSKITLQMHPNNLGNVGIIIEFNDEKVVSIRFMAENRNTSELLAKDFAVLERELSKVVNIDRETSLSFDFKGDNSGNSSHQAEQNKKDILSTPLMLQEDTASDNSKKNRYGASLLRAGGVDIEV